LLHESEFGMFLPIPPGVKVDAITRFLEHGHGYSWLTVSRSPVIMILGRSSKRGLPDLVIVNRTLHSSELSQTIRERFGMMLEHLERQSKGGV
jgi:hypothetical protein